MRKLASMTLAAGFTILAACGGSGGSGYGTGPGGGNTGGNGGGNDTCPANTVCMRAASFSPTSVSVAKGATVTFSNNSTVDHHVVFDTPLPEAVADIGTISGGYTATRMLGTSGTYNFHCTIHAGMTGSVVVQ